VKAFVSWLLSIVVDRGFAAIRGMFSDWLVGKNAKAAGAAEARVEGLKQQDAAETGTQDAINQARDHHATDPTDGAFKNTEFRD
jgi:hypothetical protein